MSTRNSFATFSDAFLHSVRTTIECGEEVPGVIDPLSVGSDFGTRARNTRELIAHSFRIENPLASLGHSPPRPLRPGYLAALLLWTLRGSDSVAEIATYNERGNSFSDDGAHLSGAFGRRLLGDGSATNQLDAIAETLRGDRHSRRTVAAILRTDDNMRESREYPCAVATQYLVRNDKLCSITYMRSQSALMVLPYDAFLFMSLQAILAEQLGLSLGHYTHCAGSFHIYDEEIDIATAVCDAGVAPVYMPPICGLSDSIANAQLLERKLRTALADKSAHTVLNVCSDHAPSRGFFGAIEGMLMAHAVTQTGADFNAVKLPTECEGLKPLLQEQTT